MDFVSNILPLRITLQKPFKYMVCLFVCFSPYSRVSSRSIPKIGIVKSLLVLGQFYKKLSNYSPKLFQNSHSWIEYTILGRRTVSSCSYQSWYCHCYLFTNLMGQNVFHYGYNSHFPEYWWGWVSLHVLTSHSCFFCALPVHILHPHFNELFPLFLFVYVNSLTVLDSTSLFSCISYKYFLQSVA